MALIRKNNTTIAAVPLGHVEDWLAGEDLRRADVTVEATASETRAVARNRVRAGAGDAETLIGTYGDAVAFLLVEVAAFMSATSAATSIARVRTAAALLATALKPLTDGVADGTIRLPYRIKEGGQDAALAEINSRIRQVADAFEADDGQAA